MIIIIYSETNSGTIASNLGLPEYSYYFVLKEFRPVLEQLGIVVTVTDPAREVDDIYRSAAAHGQSCVFLSFSPPHKTAVGLTCPTIPVFAWEFSTLPNEVWFGEPRHDWRYVFDKVGSAITHSVFTADSVRRAMMPQFPVASIPAPVWDRFSALREKLSIARHPDGVDLLVEGTVIDSRTADLSPYSVPQRRFPKPNLVRPPALARREPAKVHIAGVVYTSVFNPYDGRKNWYDMISAFCWAFRDTADATLVLKLTHHDVRIGIDNVLENVYKLTPFKCRILLIHGYLSDADYEKLVSATTYVLNTSHGEGQCLPLMEFMSCGKPAIAPVNTAMADYIDRDNAFVLDSSTEPSHWPHDPRQAYRTLRYRIDWGTLLAAYKESYRVAKQDPQRYWQMAEHAVQSLQQHCSRAVVKQRLDAFLSERIARHRRDIGNTTEKVIA
ncbi:glycosyltransferase [Collimonas sp.]|jgi:glycosyltransferase involved in cell wall biosynthesis|uniref:glycosyltransferase n=1 Tax=Collimonas sp. TaxID=1963772 RepID=UPI002CE6FB23|nr:glycosyltransferase [Collimonas sp.]HWX01924.1 glycosyltransferase [Collimonas sp.]